MALPKQVQAQLVEIEALEKSLSAQFQPDEGPDEPDTEAVETAAEASPAKPEKAKPTDIAADQGLELEAERLARGSDEAK